MDNRINLIQVSKDEMLDKVNKLCQTKIRKYACIGSLYSVKQYKNRAYDASLKRTKWIEYKNNYIGQTKYS